MAYINGERVLIERRRLGMNQDVLARRAGLSAGSYISQIENEHADNVGLRVVFSLADALGVSAAYLLGFTDDPLAQMDDAQVVRDPGQRYVVNELMEIYEDLSPEQRQTLLYVARQFRDANTPRIIE